LKNDTLYVEELKILPIGKQLNYQHTAWTIDKLFFQKGKSYLASIDSQFTFPVSINEPGIKSDFKFHPFPNFAIDKIHLYSEIENINNLKIFSIHGQLLMEKIFRSNFTVYDVNKIRGFIMCELFEYEILDRLMAALQCLNNIMFISASCITDLRFAV
jgi:hypothetical protein